jgi:uncharacterized protein (DUF1697 family)
MITYIALFRGINVGGKSSLPMQELVPLLRALGARNVKTYIRSGNAVFQHQDKDRLRLASGINAAIRERFGFEPHVLLLDPEELEQAIVGNPFPEAQSEPSTLHVGFLASAPPNPDLESLASLKKQSERFLLKDALLYLHAPEGVGRSKLAANAERLLGVSMTDRNWRTILKLRDMAEDLS